MKRIYESPEFDVKKVRFLRDVLTDSQPEPTETIIYNDPNDPDIDPFA